jgi:hypothetical protein
MEERPRANSIAACNGSVAGTPIEASRINYFGPVKLGRMNERILRIEDHKGRTVRRGPSLMATDPADAMYEPRSAPKTCTPQLSHGVVTANQLLPMSPD